MKKVKKKVSLIIYWGKNRNIVQQQHAQKQFIELVSHQNKNGKKRKEKNNTGYRIDDFISCIHLHISCVHCKIYYGCMFRASYLIQFDQLNYNLYIHMHID